MPAFSGMSVKHTDSTATEITHTCAISRAVTEPFLDMDSLVDGTSTTT